MKKLSKPIKDFIGPSTHVFLKDHRYITFKDYNTAKKFAKELAESSSFINAVSIYTEINFNPYGKGNQKMTTEEKPVVDFRWTGEYGGQNIILAALLEKYKTNILYLESSVNTRILQ